VRSSLKATAGLFAAGALLPIGLTACTAPTTPLSCTAVAATPSPAQNSVETITIKTAAGAVAATKAVFKTPSGTGDTAITTAGFSPVNGRGVGKVTYQVGSTAANSPVTVNILVAKAGKAAKCQTTFTPKKALQAAIVPSWAGLGLGSTLPSSCSTPHGDNGCGSLNLDVTVSGFSAYGGIPACPAGSLYSAGCETPTWRQNLTGTVAVAWTLTCSTDGQTKSGSAVVDVLGPYPGYGANVVNSDNRVNADTVHLVAVAGLPLQADAAQPCAGTRTLDSVTASAIALHLQGPSTPFPTSNFSAAGPFVKSDVS
jgi:hypothetical protein